jgi:hypothetical protein
VDRAALDCALELGMEYEGWCPVGGWAEDSPDPPGLLAAYPLLRETPSRDPAQRTEWNVRDSAVTLILTSGGTGAPSPGTEFTARVAAELGRPCLSVSLVGGPEPGSVAEELAAILGEEGSLNVAGPRESGTPGIYVMAKAFLGALLRELGVARL